MERLKSASIAVGYYLKQGNSDPRGTHTANLLTALVNMADADGKVYARRADLIEISSITKKRVIEGLQDLELKYGLLSFREQKGAILSVSLDGQRVSEFLDKAILSFGEAHGGTPKLVKKGRSPRVPMGSGFEPKEDFDYMKDRLINARSLTDINSLFLVTALKIVGREMHRRVVRDPFSLPQKKRSQYIAGWLEPFKEVYFHAYYGGTGESIDSYAGHDYDTLAKYGKIAIDILVTCVKVHHENSMSCVSLKSLEYLTAEVYPIKQNFWLDGVPYVVKENDYGEWQVFDPEGYGIQDTTLTADIITQYRSENE